jgi:threonine synthase
MPAESLRCRVCERAHPVEPLAVCTACWGPLDPAYDDDLARRGLTPERLAAAPHHLWRYAPLLPVPAPEPAVLAPGWTPLVPAPRLASALGVGELLLKLDTANPTHSFKDRVVAVAAAAARSFGLDTLACSSTGNLANAVAARAAAEGLGAVALVPAGTEREKLVATAVHGATVYAVRGSYDDCSRLSVELSFELPWAFVNVGLRSYYAEGSKTVAYELAEQLGGRLPDVVVAPVASGALFGKVGQGFGDALRLGLAEGELPRLVGAQAAGCSPVADAWAAGDDVRPVRPATRALSLAIGNPADGPLALRTARETGGAILAVAEEEIGPAVGDLAALAGVWGEGAAGVTIGALRQAVELDLAGPRDRVVALVTGDGLKTPALARAADPIEVEADADALLELVQARQAA